MPFIKLQSSDGEIFSVELAIARKSITIKTMIEDLKLEENDENLVPLPNLTSQVLKMIIEWCTYHKDEPAPPEVEETKGNGVVITTWDHDFLEVDQSKLFELVLAANFLDIKGLIKIGCKTIANMIGEKSPEDIRKSFNIKNDFTPEQEEKIRKQLGR